MKHLLRFTGCLLLGFAIALSTASANSWGLTGELFEAVSAVDTWDDYTTLCKQAGNFAVMYSRHQNVLMIVHDGVLSAYPLAVYQPDAMLGSTVTLTQTETGFTLSYGDTEWYTFVLLGDTYALQTAVIGDFRLDAEPTGSDTAAYGLYTATVGTESAVLQQSITIDAFNITLLAHSLDEVRNHNLMRTALYSHYDCLNWSTYMDMPELGYRSNVGTGTEPVYAAPYGASAWRAAGGKAAVGLKGDLWVIRTFRDGNGDCYACIRYNINSYTQRIGYIRSSVLGITCDDTQSVTGLSCVDVQATKDTYLTEDPDVSQTVCFTVPQGRQFACLGIYNASYAYVTAEVRDGEFVDGGAIVWGFVPLNALTLDPNDDFRSAVQTDIMELLAGAWTFDAGGSMAEEHLILNADGTYLCGYEGHVMSADDPATHGTWKVTKYNSNWNLYWADVQYELTLIRADGVTNVKGLLIDSDDEFSLLTDEGSGGYVRVDPATFLDITTPAQNGQAYVDTSSEFIIG